MKRTMMMKSTVFTVATIAGITAAFMGLTQAIVKAEYNNINKIPTSYGVAGVAYNTQSRPVPEGYEKANYIVEDFTFLGSMLGETPTVKDIPRDEAAETGVQALFELYQLDMTGKTVHMSYHAAKSGMRPQWSGSYWVDGVGTSDKVYDFTVDSITGELLTVQYQRFPSPEDIVDEEVFNMEIHENPQAYEALAISYAEKFNIITGPIEKSEYHRQYSSYGSAFIDLYVYGENGERAFLEIDSSDDTLVGVAYNAGCLQMDEIDKWLEEEAQKEQ